MSTAAATVEAPEPPPQIPSDLILVSKAAAMVQKSVGYIYLHIRGGRLRAYKAGRYTYVPQSDVEELMKPRQLKFVPYESKPRNKLHKNDHSTKSSLSGKVAKRKASK